MHAADVLFDRSLAIWSRRSEHGTAWIGRFARAAAWLTARGPLSLAGWNASPFGARLGELTAAWWGVSGERRDVPLERAPRLVAAPAYAGRARDALLAHLARSGYAASAGGAARDANDRRHPVEQNKVYSAGRHGARASLHDARRAAKHEAFARRFDGLSSAVTLAQLLALAGEAPHAAQRLATAAPGCVERARRSHVTEQRSDVHDRQRGFPASRPDGSALGARLATRLQRSFEHFIHRAVEGRASSSELLWQAGWQGTLCDSVHNFVFEHPDAAESLSADSSSTHPGPAPAAPRAADAPERPRVAHPALEPGIFPARAHTDGAAYETTTPHSDASAAPLSDAPRERDGLSPLRADASNGRLAMSPGSPRDIDPVEFAEHLRRALVDDARRHGIEV